MVLSCDDLWWRRLLLRILEARLQVFNLLNKCPLVVASNVPFLGSLMPLGAGE